jgi:FtsZ-binding cell division protein ZapB
MDLITQIQNYMSSLSLCMAAAIEQANDQAQPVLPSILLDKTDAKIATANAPTDLSQPPAMPVASVSVVTNNYIAANSEFLSQLNDRSAEIFDRFSQVDQLIQCLPDYSKNPNIYSENHQLQQLTALQRENEQLDREIAAENEEAQLWQQRVSFILQNIRK